MLRDRALEILGITKHRYYYKPSGGKKGRRPSEATPKLEKGGGKVEVANNEVVGEIARIKSDPDTDYGYRAMTSALMLLGYIINHKKVYRLMEAHQLLQERAKRPSREYAKHRRVSPLMPLQALEMDIKFQWMELHQCYAYILTILDCFTRKALYWTAAYSIKQHQVIAAWEKVIVDYLQPFDMLGKEITVEARNDNDSRFAAKSVQKYMADNHLGQVFTHPYTPQENGHIESFHAILGRSLERRAFGILDDLLGHLSGFYQTYNTVRLHGSLDHLPPDLFWKLWREGLIETQKTKHGGNRHKLKIPHYNLSGNGSLRECPAPPEGRKEKVRGTNAPALAQPSVQRSPSVVSGNANLVTLKTGLLTSS